ncbi:MAG TPA: VOC family protein [Vicinamibacterales bacterium]
MASKRKKPARRPSRRASRKRAPAAAATPASVGSGLAPAMQAVNTYLAVANVKASIDFLERAFGFTRGVILPGVDGQPRYAEMRHGDSVVMLIPKGDGTSATGGVAGLYTYVGDVDKALTRARAAGAGVSEAEDRPWGDRTATVTDPDGYRWVLATFKKLVPFS